ncbi:MAG TPA: type II secretion system F family protein [Dehalococcoidia bacterium]
MALAIVAAVLVFVAVTALLLVLLSRGTDRVLEDRLDSLATPAEDRSVGNVLKRDSGTFPFLRRLVGGGWSERAAMDLAQAGMSLKVSEYLMIRLLVGGVVATLIFVLTAGSALGVLIAIVAGLAGFMVPALIVSIRRSRRQAALSEQLPEMLALISNSLRSGFAFTQAVELAAKQIEPPIQEELLHLQRDTSLGAPMDEALQAMADRTGSYDLEMIVSSILIQRTTGGNLSEILDNVAATVRERERLQGEIRALTASQRFTGLVLSIYPIGLGLLLAALAPSVWKVLVTEESGRILLVIAGILQVMGIITIRRILRLEV